MSKALGSSQLMSILSGSFLSDIQKLTLKIGTESTYRKELDNKPVIMGISLRELEPNSIVSKADFTKSYNIFISVIDTFFNKYKSRTFNTFKEYYDHKKAGKTIPPGVVYIKHSLCLLAKDFLSIRNFITENISKNPSLKNNTYFGLELRYVSYLEYGSTLEEANNSEEAKKFRYEWNNTSTNINKKQLFKENQSIFTKSGDSYYLCAPNNKRVKTNRSVLDIGHLSYDDSSTPVTAKISSIITSGAFSTNAEAEAFAALEKIQQAHIELSFSFDNKSHLVAEAEGRLSLTLQHWRLNNKIAVVEGEAYRKLLFALAKEIAPELLNISGSNTLLQDITSLIVTPMTGKTSPVKPHSKAIASIKKTVKLSNKGVSRAPSNITNSYTKLRTTSGQFYSLANLQVLINTHLQDVISANMGNEPYPGGQRRILNYRTGRFAASAQVERMSQSREGLITAFYSYMKNPYATFEPTGKQGSPKTRDPRLLIAGSIREIAATMVKNKMRSVSI